MAQTDNRRIVEEIYAAFRRRDVAAILALQADKAEWTVAASRDAIPWAAPGAGHAGVRDFLRILSEWLIADVFTIREYLVNGDTVVALGFQKGSVRPTGAAYEFDFVHVWTLSGGLVTSFRVYYDTEYVAGRLKARG